MAIDSAEGDAKTMAAWVGTALSRHPFGLGLPVSAGIIGSGSYSRPLARPLPATHGTTGALGELVRRGAERLVLLFFLFSFFFYLGKPHHKYSVLPGVSERKIKIKESIMYGNSEVRHNMIIYNDSCVIIYTICMKTYWLSGV